MAPASKYHLPIGTRYGWLTVIGHETHRHEHGRTRLVIPCRCDCGRVCRPQKDQLRRGWRKHCNACSHRVYRGLPAGAKYGRWTVCPGEGLYGHKGERTRVECRCECGTHKMVRIDHLLFGTTQGCQDCAANARRKRDEPVKVEEREYTPGCGRALSELMRMVRLEVDTYPPDGTMPDAIEKEEGQA